MRWRHASVEGEWESKTQEIPKGRGVVWPIYFPEVPWFNTDLSVDLAVQKSFLTTKQIFHMKNSGLNTCIWLALYLKYIFFLQKAPWKLTNAKNVPLRGNGHVHMYM